jgi:hypothetical protein
VLPALPAENKILIDDIWTTRKRYGLKAVYHAGPLWSLFEELLPLWDYLNERSIDFQAGDRWVSFTARDWVGAIVRYSRVRCHWDGILRAGQHSPRPET